MPSLQVSPPRTTTQRPTPRRAALRWLVTFTGFPLGGLGAIALTGPVDSLGPALAGGLVTGTVVGAVQAWGLRGRVRHAAWVVATAIGLMTGLALGSAVVDHGTAFGDLVVQGAISGVFVGAAQAVVLRSRIGAAALAWPAFLAGVWAAGWAVTTLGGIQVEDQFTVFGAYGAITATVLTALLPLLIDRRGFATDAS